MARIIPRISGAAIPSVAERQFLDAVTKYLDDHFLVFHSVPWVHVQSHLLRQGECDFLILHPQLGLFSIETKPGDVHYEGKHGLWLRTDGTALKHDPFLQAQRSAHSISQFLGQALSGWKEQGLPVNYAVYFCGADQVTGRMPPHVTPLITLLEGDMPHLQDRLTNMARHFKGTLPQPSGDLIRKAVTHLRPEFQLIQKFSTQLNLLEQELHRLTQQQIQVLDALEENRRLLIKGCAGSGKTLLALEKASRLARVGKRVLLLCYNIPLAQWLKLQVEQEQLNISVNHFHGICQEFAELSGLPFVLPEEADSVAEFYDTTAPTMLEQAIRQGVGQRYDAIIVDEGQDFVADWWLAIEELLANPKEGLLYIFYDPDQNIFQRQFGFLVDEARFLLNRNCRNSPQISEFVSHCAGKDFKAAEFSLDGPMPVEVDMESPEAELAKVDSIVKQLVQQKNISPDRIVVLGLRRKVNSPYARVQSLGGVPLVDEASGESWVGKVRYATIFRFKGLEADCVILTGVSRRNEQEVDQTLYCAASRARFLLYVLYQSANQPINQ